MRRAGMSELLVKTFVDVYSALSYHLLVSFGWRRYHGVECSKLNVVDVTYWIPSHVWRGFDEEKITFSRAVLIRQYQFLVL